MHGGNSSKYVVLGAGISGLTCAHFLKKQFPEAQVTLIEKSSKVGGWIQTLHTFGYLFEMGPHLLRLQAPYDAACYTLFEDLNLTDSLIEPHSSFKTRLIAHSNQLTPLNVSPALLLHPKNFIKLTYPILKNTLFKKAFSEEDVSIASFFNHHFGSFITHHYVNPMMMGIQGGDIRELSIQACLPMLYEMSQTKTPLVRALLRQKRSVHSRFISFKEGLSTLIKALYNELQEDCLLDTEALEISGGRKMSLRTSKGEIECDHIFSTLPSYALAKILKPLELSSISFLEDQKHVSYKLVHLGYAAKLDLPRAFGYIAPSWSLQQISGVIFDSNIFPEQNFHTHQTRLTAMVHENSNLFHLCDKAFEEAFFNELNTVLKIHVQPQYFEVFNLDQAIPQYQVGHPQALKNLRNELEKRLPSFHFCGSSFDGISVPQCIHQAQRVSSLVKPNVYTDFGHLKTDIQLTVER